MTWPGLACACGKPWNNFLNYVCKILNKTFLKIKWIQIFLIYQNHDKNIDHFPKVRFSRGTRTICEGCECREMAKSNIRRSFSPNVSRQPFFRTYVVRMSQDVRKKFAERSRNNRANFAACTRHSANCRDLVWGFTKILRTSRTSDLE